MTRKPSLEEQKAKEQLFEHYEVEKQLADRLRNATKNERRKLYTSLYEELYRLIPHHSQLTRKESPEQQQKVVQNQMEFLNRLLDENMSFLEVGPGDCALSFHVADIVKEAFAVDVSNTITEASSTPENFTLLLSDGCSIPVPEKSIDVIYSNQLMEHIHPDDAYDQLKNIFQALAPAGVYLCITPNRLTGPHDISKGFDPVATGFHLKEYTITELTLLFKKAGFSKVIINMKLMGNFIRFPILPVILFERMLERLPVGIRTKLVDMNPVKRFLKIRLLGVK